MLVAVLVATDLVSCYLHSLCLTAFHVGYELQPTSVCALNASLAQWRTQKIFMGGGLVQGHMVVICICCALFVTSQFDVMSMFPNQRFGEVC